MNRIATAAVSAFILLAAAGCSAGATKAAPASDSPSAASEVRTEAPSQAPKPSPSPSPSKKSALIVKFGETIEYADGVKVTVKHTGTVTGSAYAAPESARGAEIQLFEITLVNGTADTFEPASFYYTVVHGAAGTPGEKVFDSNSNVSAGYFSGVIVPGGTQTITTAIAIPAADLPTTAFSLQPGFKYKASVVTGGL